MTSSDFFCRQRCQQGFGREPQRLLDPGALFRSVAEAEPRQAAESPGPFAVALRSVADLSAGRLKDTRLSDILN